MDTKLEVIEMKADKLRWMIRQLDASCDGTEVMILYIECKKKLLRETMAEIANFKIL